MNFSEYTGISQERCKAILKTPVKYSYFGMPIYKLTDEEEYWAREYFKYYADPRMSFISMLLAGSRGEI